MMTEVVRKAPLFLVVALGMLSLSASARGEEGLSSAVSTSFPDLSPNLSLAIPAGGPGLLEGQTPPPPAPVTTAGPIATREGHLAAKTGLGFTLSPDEFLLILQGDYFFTNNVSVGPLLQFGVDDDPFIFAPTVNVTGLFDLPDMEKLKPFIQGGLGLAYMERDRPNQPSRDDVGFMFNIGGGVEFFLTDRLSIGNNIMFNVMPVDVLGDHFFFSWQFVTVRFQF